MADESTEILGTYLGRTYYLTIRVSPILSRVRDFAAVVHYSSPDDPGRDIQIARIDTTHGYSHFDRLYRRDQPKERLDVDVWEAAALLEENWRTYARSFADLGRK